jgi:hypothetical protein
MWQNPNHKHPRQQRQLEETMGEWRSEFSETYEKTKNKSRTFEQRAVCMVFGGKSQEARNILYAKKNNMFYLSALISLGRQFFGFSFN